jgi:hypothetical protein
MNCRKFDVATLLNRYYYQHDASVADRKAIDELCRVRIEVWSTNIQKLLEKWRNVLVEEKVRVPGRSSHN